MQLTITPNQKTKLSHQEREFNKAWQQVLQQKEENNALEQKVKSFAEQVMQRLEPAENLMALHQCALISNLLRLYTRKSLSQWQRDELRDWILENLDAVSANPFTPQPKLREVQLNAETVFEIMHPELADDDWDDDAEEVTDDFIDDLFGFEAEEEDLNLDGDDDIDESLFEKLEGERLKFKELERQNSQSLDQLLKKSSINTLFRQLVGVLHPDRADTEAERIKRHHLMSEVTQARDQKDIPKLFSLYQEHLGRSPLDLLGDQADLETVTLLLKKQLQQLKQNQQEIIYSDPIAGALYEYFHKGSTKATEKAIRGRLNEIKSTNQSLGHLVNDITSLARLKPYLEERNEMRFLNSFSMDPF